MTARIVVCTVTEAGGALARRLPYEHRPGGLVATVRSCWAEADGFVLVCATGIAVRAIAPMLADKAADPAVVVVDDAGRFAVALAGGHRGGANVLAREVAALTGAEAVVTTATDAAGLPALDDLPGFAAAGDFAAVSRAWLDGAPPDVAVDDALREWPLPRGLPSPGARRTSGGGDAGGEPAHGEDGGGAPRDGEDNGGERAAGRVVLTDRAGAPGTGEVFLRPKSLVLGVGSSRGADPDGLRRLVREALEGAGLSPEAVACVATLDRKADEPAIAGLAAGFGGDGSSSGLPPSAGPGAGVPLRAFPAGVLAGMPAPNPSPVVAGAVGTPSVAEAAALAAAGPGAELVVEKRRSGDATVAVARRRRPEGHLAVVGLGPGDPALRTPAAAAAVVHAEVVIGYGPYVDLAGDLLSPRQEVLRSPIGAEAERVTEALRRAADGARVALVCSGDPGVYAMASLVVELAPHHGDPPVTVVPGVTAALAAAAVLGAPLGHDHAAVSLSDLLTPWEVIERRLRAVAEGDFTVSLYNPRSKRRTTQLGRALEILAAHRPAGTPAAILTDVGRPGARVVRTTLGALDPEQVDMLSLVVLGSCSTRWIGDRMVTPRGYAGAGGGPDGDPGPAGTGEDPPGPAGAAVPGRP